MIRIANKQIADFIDYLNLKYPDVPDVYIYVIPNHEVIEVPDGKVAFAAYNHNENTIYAAGEPIEEDEERILQNIAHEFYHHIQAHKENNEEYEIAAEKYTQDVLNEYLRAGKNNGM